MSKQAGSITPLLAVVVVVIVFFSLASLAVSEMAAERARQQASADLAALAGAGQLAKAVEKTRAIDGAIWMRNVTLDALYLAASIATLGSAGAGAEAFAIPLKFQKATIRPVEVLETVKTGTAAYGLAAAGRAGVRIVKENGPQDRGAAVPVILPGSVVGPGQRYKDLEKRIKSYDQRIDQATSEMNDILAAYEKHKSALKSGGLSEKEVRDHPETERLLKKVREGSGRVGGLSTWRNKSRNELSRLSRKGVLGLPDAVVAGVFHPSTPVPFSGSLGGVETGNNIALAAAAVVDAPANNVIGSDALKRAVAGVPLAGAAAERLDGLLDAVNLFGHRARSQGDNLGVLGGLLNQAIDKLGIVPPPLSEARPSLVSIQDAVGNNLPDEIFQLIERAGSR